MPHFRLLAIVTGLFLTTVSIAPFASAQTQACRTASDKLDAYKQQYPGDDSAAFAQLSHEYVKACETIHTNGQCDELQRQYAGQLATVEGKSFDGYNTPTAGQRAVAQREMNVLRPQLAKINCPVPTTGEYAH